MNNNIDDHIYNDSNFCINCLFTEVQIRLFIKRSCAEIIKNSKSHVWHGSFDYGYPLICEICDIKGINISKCYLFPDNCYSCNEYLMIKANE